MMKSKNTFYILSLFIGISSCSPKFYSANTQNVPMISERGQTNISLAGNGNQVEAQGAAGLTKNVSVMFNGGLYIPSDLDNGNGGSGNFIEVGAGYFKPLAGRFVFETYGLLGIGSFENHLPSTMADNPGTEGDISASIFRYGLQPSIGYKSKRFSAGFSMRLVNLMYSNVEGDLIFDGVDQVNYLKASNSSFLMEPAITLRAGGDVLKFQFQMGYSLNLSNSDFRQDETFATIGLNFNI